MGPIAIIRIHATDMDALAQELDLKTPGVGGIALDEPFGIDEALLVRPAEDTLLVTPHGGVEIVRRISTRLAELGVTLAETADPMRVYPEACDIHEARMLEALARCESPRGVDLLLDQPRRWRDAGSDPDGPDPVLHRLLQAPIVVAMGRPNIGKSSLLNALAAERVALVWDQEGTTRDHVGVRLVLDGLAVHWIDAPGITGAPDERDRPEIRALAPVLERAALVVCAHDASDPPGARVEAVEALAPRGVDRIRVALRADLTPDHGHEDRALCVCSARTGEGIVDLARRVRSSLVPDAALGDPRPWPFWRAGV